MRKSIDPMSDPATAGSGNSWLPPQRSSAAMSLQSAIPWRVALRQSLPPLHRLATILNNPLCRTMIFQRTATTPLTSCLSPRVHSTEICRKVGISEGTYYAWKKQYAGLGVSELRELRQLREENGRLKRLVADLSLDRQILQEIVSKKL